MYMRVGGPFIDSPQDLGRWIQLLEHLLTIEQKTGVMIKQPRSASLWDLENAKRLSALLTGNKTQVDKFECTINLTKDGARKMLDSLTSLGFVLNVTLRIHNFKMKLFSYEFDLGTVRVEMPQACAVEDLASLRKQYDELTVSQSLRIRLTSCDDKNPVLTKEFPA
ncbi:MAG: hypothetical protein ABSF00_08680 [Candidatus Bathyarchaeia archaeon]|jgi:hypothetical protein